MRNNNQTIKNKFFSSVNDFQPLLESWKMNNEKIVFTNGCFDIVHLGHVDYLSKAADLGSKLIVGLNSDASTQRLKGATRPINPEISRAGILASFFFIDAVILFDEDTPLDLIKNILPNVLVKGADYSIDQIVGAKEVLENGGDVETIKFLDGYSTSLIEQKILKAHQ
nr:D-glycero-beta-D-manno-heptose 1-phosphate adenylyltransferase [Pseudopedobacter sp.]